MGFASCFFRVLGSLKSSSSKCNPTWTVLRFDILAIDPFHCKGSHRVVSHIVTLFTTTQMKYTVLLWSAILHCLLSQLLVVTTAFGRSASPASKINLYMDLLSLLALFWYGSLHY